MDIIMIWLRFGYLVYWLGWFGSMLLFDVSVWCGILIGIVCIIVWAIVLAILSKIIDDTWFWEW